MINAVDIPNDIVNALKASYADKVQRRNKLYSDVIHYQRQIETLQGQIDLLQAKHDNAYAAHRVLCNEVVDLYAELRSAGVNAQIIRE